MEERTTSDIIVKLIVDIIKVLGDNLVVVILHLISAFSLLMIISNLTGNTLSFGEFGGVDDYKPRAYQNSNTGNIIENLYGRPVSPLNSVHYIAGSQMNGAGTKQIQIGDSFDYFYYGRDYINDCGTELYAPFDANLTYQSDIGGGTPQLTLSSLNGIEVIHIMHLDVEKQNGVVKQGDLIGHTNTHGAYSSQCHEHVSYYVNGILADVEYPMSK